MREWALLALSIVSGAQDTARPVADPTVIDPEIGTDVLDANRTASSATAAQTAKMLQDKDANARNIAAYEKARADYARNVADYEARTAANARKAALDAEAYRQSMAMWQSDIDRRRLALRKPPRAAPVAKTPPKVICGYEQQTGSLMQRRVCRSSTDRP